MVDKLKISLNEEHPEKYELKISLNEEIRDYFEHPEKYERCGIKLFVGIVCLFIIIIGFFLTVIKGW